MRFDLEPDQREIRDTVRAYASGRLAEGYLERARSTRFAWEIHRELGDMGVLGMLAGPEHGPFETADFVGAGVVIEELARADFNVANAVIPVMLTSSLLAEHASAAVRETWLGPLVRGETYLAFALTEPHAGSDVRAISTTATARADGGYVLTGEKTSVTALPHAGAALVVARTIRDGEPVGASVFLVPLDAPGVVRSVVPDTGWAMLGRGILHLDGVEIGADALVGAEGSAFRSVLGGFDFTRPLLALTGIGCASQVVEDTAAHVAQRPAFGAPLSTYEGVSFPLAEHLTQLHAARLLCYSALWHRGAQRRHTSLAAMSKWYGPLQASAAIQDCLLLHGNYGYSTELPLEQKLRDVLSVQIADGTAQIQKIIIAREEFGPEFLPYGKTPAPSSQRSDRHDAVS